MSRSPFLSPTSKLDSCDASHASSSSIADDIIRDFDPHGVDFEPLFVSGTGKILNYHRSSFLEDEEGISLSSTSTPVAGNGRGNGASSDNSRLPSRPVRALALLSLMMLLSLFATDNYPHRLQTTVMKKVAGIYHSGVNDIMQQNMMDANAAALEASSKQVVFWEPYSDLPGASANSALMEASMTFVVQCFGRPISMHRSYQLQRVETLAELPRAGPTVVFTLNVRQSAIELFDQYRKGAFIAFIHDPVGIYTEHYAKQQSEPVSIQNSDNLLVRQLAGIERENREVNDDDLRVAKHMLMSKFVIGSCDNPAATLQRLLRMMGSAESSAAGSESCTRERQRWIQECRKANEMSQKMKHDPRNTELLRRITLEHRYDVMLYEESKDLFRKQKAIFE